VSVQRAQETFLNTQPSTDTPKPSHRPYLMQPVRQVLVVREVPRELQQERLQRVHHLRSGRVSGRLSVIELFSNPSNFSIRPSDLMPPERRYSARRQRLSLLLRCGNYCAALGPQKCLHNWPPPISKSNCLSLISSPC
jgi:hypothetical protein